MFNRRNRPQLPPSVAAPRLALALAAAATGPAGAVERCGDLHVLVTQAQSNFSGIAAGGTAPAPPPLPGAAADCAVSPSLSGRNVYQCAWEYPYRSPHANEAFEALHGLIGECFGDRAPMRKDPGVNHPDFYDLRQYRLDHVDLSVSIKEKAALQATFVFLRIHGVALD